MINRQLHRLWQRLPPGWRRRAYEAITAAAAPRTGLTPATPRAPTPPFIVAGALSAPTGLGEAARSVLRGLVATGLPVSIVDLSASLMQRAVVPLPDLPPAPTGPGTLLLFAQPPNVAHALSLIGRKRLRDKRRIGCWVWDLEAVPDAWVAQASFVHEVATPSRFCMAAFARALPVPVRLLAYPLSVSRPAVRRPPSAGSMTFGAALDLGSTAARKNPLAAVDAFRQAFAPGDPVRLVIKLRDEGADPATFAKLQALAAGAPAVELVTGDLDADRLEAWWTEIDVLVSLHRSEGFGLVPAEAMQRGIPCIATDWSATAEFVRPEAGWPVPASLVPVRDPTGRYELPGALWAEPDVSAAAAAMREAASDRQATLERGSKAAALMVDLYSLERFRRELGV